MIINRDCYECPKCRESFFFETAKPFSTICPNCRIEMEFVWNMDCDTERAEKIKNAPKYDPTKDPASPYYIPVIICPTCRSQRVHKITHSERTMSVFAFGWASGKIGKSFECDSCGYRW